MNETSTLYPLELFRLLEVMWRERFSGTIVLRARDETATIYLQEGSVRYATTTEITGTFPGYLLSEQLFSREKIHDWLERCGEEQRTLEDLLLAEGVLDARAVVAIKADQCTVVFARAFSLKANVEVRPNRGDALIFGDLVLNPHDALFQCVAEGFAYPHRVQDLRPYLTHKILERGPTFFRLWPLFRRWFDTAPVAALFDSAEGLSGLDPSKKKTSLKLTYTYLMRETAMAHFADEPPRESVLHEDQKPSPPSPKPAPKPAPAKPLRREPTVPGGYPIAKVPSISGPLAPPPPANPERRVSPQVPRGNAAAPFDDPSESFADLRGSLVGGELIEASELARTQTCYAFLGLKPSAPLSEIRAGWLAMRRRYEDDRYQGLMLRTAAATALKELQKRTEFAYDTLTDLRRRQEHDARFGIEDALSKDMLEDVFYAEGLFKAAQIRLTEGSHAEAVQLLDEAFIRSPTEPEYLSYLAFAIFTGQEASKNLGPIDEEPDALLARALAMNPKLESAWLFKARMMDMSGQASHAMGAYLTVLDIDAHNDEAKRAVRAFREAGVSPSGRLRRGLAQRLGRLLGGRGSR